MQSEMQELIAAAQDAGKYVNGSSRHSTETKERLDSAIAAARASEGGWVDPKVVRPERGRWLVYFPAESTSVMDALFDGKDFWVDGVKRTKSVIAYQRLPSPPLSVETPEVSK